MQRRDLTGRPALFGWLAVVALGGGLTGCGLEAQSGDCGQVLSSAECGIVRSQLGALPSRPPADPSNRFGRCEKDGTSECLAEELAVQLGQRLFFDRCMSVAKNTACATCHDPQSGYIDNRARPIQTSVTTMVGGMPMTVAMPFLQKRNPDGSLAPLTPDLVNVPPPEVTAQTDITGAPLAHFDTQKWVPVVRRPQSSYGSTLPGKAQASTGRQSPSLYNIAYGAVLPNSDGGRTGGAIWGPWDGRYDSHWALVMNVWEFGGTHNTDRSHIALRIAQKHRAQYEAMTGSALPDFQTVDAVSGKFNYPRHGGANAPTSCWFTDPAKCTDAVALPPTPEIRDQINQVFVNAGKALSAFQRRLRSNQSPYDRWLAGDPTALSGTAQRGLQLFIGKAECVLCHNGPNFTDSRFHNLGVPSYDLEARTAGSAIISAPADVQSGCFPGIAPNAFCPDPGRNGWQARAAGQCLVDSAAVGTKTATCQRSSWPAASNRFDVAVDCRSPASDASDKIGDTQCLPQTLFPASKCSYQVASACQADPLCDWVDQPSARCFAKSDPRDLGQFKTPTLRNVALTFPYMHNGALFDYGPAERGDVLPTDATPHLRRVVNFYNTGGGQPTIGALDSQIHKLNLSGDEVDAIVEFLKALTDNSIGSDPTNSLAQTPADLTDLTDCPN